MRVFEHHVSVRVWDNEYIVLAQPGEPSDTTFSLTRMGGEGSPIKEAGVSYKRILTRSTPASQECIEQKGGYNELASWLGLPVEKIRFCPINEIKRIALKHYGLWAREELFRSSACSLQELEITLLTEAARGYLAPLLEVDKKVRNWTGHLDELVPLIQKVSWIYRINMPLTLFSPTVEGVQKQWEAFSCSMTNYLKLYGGVIQKARLWRVEAYIQKCMKEAFRKNVLEEKGS